MCSTSPARYRRLLDTVEAIARDVAGGSTPRMVLLTPGPYSETYFEHAYLARYLGLPLVEGGDLTVRGERLFLKTVEGLEPVHGLLRRLDDDWCDPLELRPDSALGVPGLLQAARAGTVVMANALGSAFLESPARAGFPARHRAPPARRRTCCCRRCPPGGAARPRPGTTCATRLDDKVLRSTFPRGGRTSQVRDRTSARVELDPDAWTVQDRLRFSRAPIWGGGMLSPRPAMVRVYAIADGGGRWHVLPGGMTRVSQREDASVCMQRGGTSLDTWVLTEGAVDTFSMLPQRLQVDDIVQRRRPVTSRTGENLFWLGRYTERTEQLVRLARATLMLIDADSDADHSLQRAVSALAVSNGLAPPGVPTLLQSAHLFERAVLAGLVGRAGGQQRRLQPAGAGARLAGAARAAVVRALGPDPQHGRHVRAGAAGRARRAADAAAGAAGAGHAGAAAGGRDRRADRPHDARPRLAAAHRGPAARTADRPDHAHRRPSSTTSALDSAAGIDLLLELFDSAITFRARYQRHEDLLALTDLLVLDSSNPRAFAACCAGCAPS